MTSALVAQGGTAPAGAHGKGLTIMARHRPAHAKSGFGRYTAPRRLHPAHAAPSADGVGVTRLAGALVGGGLLASAGLMGIIAAPSGAATLGPYQSPPFSSLGTFVTDLDGSVAGVAGGGGTLLDPATVFADAGDGSSANLDNNTAFSFAFGPGATALTSAGVGDHANLSGNTATSTVFGVANPLGGPSVGFGDAEAGFGGHANLSDNMATAWSYGGLVNSEAGVALDAGAADNVAWAGGQFAVVSADAGVGNDAGLNGNTAYAYGLFSLNVQAFAGVGTFGDYNDNLAIAQSTFGVAVSCAGVGAIIEGGCASEDLAIGFVPDGEVGPGSNNMATSGSVAGGAFAYAVGGDGNNAAASAVGGGVSIATAFGDGNTAAALGVAGGSAISTAIGTNENADATAVGAGSVAGAADVLGVSVIGAASGLGGWSDASTSGGGWTVSINGATLVS